MAKRKLIQTIIAGVVSVFLLVMIVITMVAGVRAAAINQKQTDIVEKKAMIMIPGLEGSALYDYETGDDVWSLSFDNVLSKLVTAKTRDPYTRNLFKSDENQQLVKDYRPGRMDDGETVKYSLFEVFKSLYTFLDENYSNEYEIVVWQYDWRKSNEDSAVQLEKFINARGYTKVQLFGHSMGGTVSSLYMTKPENREKIELFMPFSSPLLGSVASYENILEENDGIISKLLGKEPFLEAARVLACVPELFCVDLLNESDIFNGTSERFWVYGGDEDEKVARSAFFTIDNEPIDSKSLNKYLIENMDWALNKDGTVKKRLATIDNFLDKTLVTDKNGKTVHISSLVNTIYVGATNSDTAISYNLDTATGKLTLYRSNDGDGMVPIYSSLAGNSETAKNVVVVEMPKTNLGAHLEMVNWSVKMVIPKIQEFMGY